MFKSLNRIEALEKRLDRLLPPVAEQASQAEAVPGLMDFIPAVSPKFQKPTHLHRIADLLERAFRGEPVRAVISMPPRHGKTETLLHAIAWFLTKDPAKQVAYLGATAAVSRKKSGAAKALARRAGIGLSRDSASKSDWRTTTAEGGLWAVGVGGQVAGEGFHLVLVDDPHKSRAEAESPILRDRVYDWLKADVFTRLTPTGSVIVCHTRWHNDDLAGRLLAQGWESVHLPAISDDGLALWPTEWPLHRLLAIQDELGGPDGYDWVSLYQGKPVADGLALFKSFYSYENPPPLKACRISIGVDFGYSKKGDDSTAVVLAELDGVFYVLEVFRGHVDPRAFRAHVKALSETYHNAPVTAYVAATETGNVEFFRDGGLAVTVKRAIVDKLSNSIHVSAAWNTGKILCPIQSEDAPWVDAFLSEVKGFTGKGDRHDDQVDALAAAHDSLRLHAVDWEYLERLASAWPAPLAF